MADSNYTSWSWPQLIAGVLAKPPDGKAWEEAFFRLRRYAEQILHHYPDYRHLLPDELASEVLLRLIDPGSRSEAVMRALQESGTPEAYLGATLRNAIVTRLRRTQVERKVLKTLGEQHPRPWKEAGWFSAEDGEWLQRELHRLTPEEKELLRLRFWQELPIGEIASRLNISYSAVAVRLFRLVRKLKAILAHRPDERM